MLLKSPGCLDDDLDSIINQLTNTTHTRLPLFRTDINQIEHRAHASDRSSADAQPARGTHCWPPATSPTSLPEGTPLSTRLQSTSRSRNDALASWWTNMAMSSASSAWKISSKKSSAISATQDTLHRPDIHPQEDGTQVIDGAAYIRGDQQGTGLAPAQRRRKPLAKRSPRPWKAFPITRYA